MFMDTFLSELEQYKKTNQLEPFTVRLEKETIDDLENIAVVYDIKTATLVRLALAAFVREFKNV